MRRLADYGLDHGKLSAAKITILVLQAGEIREMQVGHDEPNRSIGVAPVEEVRTLRMGWYGYVLPFQQI